MGAKANLAELRNPNSPAGPGLGSQAPRGAPDKTKSTAKGWVTRSLSTVPNWAPFGCYMILLRKLERLLEPIYGFLRMAMASSLWELPHSEHRDPNLSRKPTKPWEKGGLLRRTLIQESRESTLSWCPFRCKQSETSEFDTPHPSPDLHWTSVGKKATWLLKLILHGIPSR